MAAKKCSKQQNMKHSGWNQQHDYVSESITNPIKHSQCKYREWIDYQLSPSPPSLKGRRLIL